MKRTIKRRITLVVLAVVLPVDIRLVVDLVAHTLAPEHPHGRGCEVGEGCYRGMRVRRVAVVVKLIGHTARIVVGAQCKQQPELSGTAHRLVMLVMGLTIGLDEVMVPGELS